MKNIQKEMDYWRNPEVTEVEEELERLHDEVPLSVAASKGPENVPISLPKDLFPFPTLRQNLFPRGGLEAIPTASVAQESSELPPLSVDQERLSALRKPYLGAPVQFVHGDSAKN